MRLVLRVLLLCAVAAAVPAAPAAAAEPNDDFDAAAPLRFERPATVAAAGGTVEPGEPLACESADAPAPAASTHWWTFTGTGRRVTLATAGSEADTVLALHAAFAERLACADVAGAPEQLSWDTTAGTRYWVQVGCAPRTAPCAGEAGTARLTATSAPPPNDARDAAVPVVDGAAVGDNHGATTEAGETVACGVGYGRTTWYHWTAPGPGVARVRVTGDARAAVAVYLETAASSLACATADAAGEGVLLETRVAGGTHLIQAGAVDGADPPSGGHAVEIGFAADPVPETPTPPPPRPVVPAVTPEAPLPPAAPRRPAVADRDGDGTVDVRDCRPNNPFVHPAAFDEPGDGIDADCSGRDAAWPVLAAQANIAWARTRSGGGYVRRIEVLRPPGRTRIVVTCTGTTCPRARPLVRSVRRAAVRVRLRLGRLGRTLLAPGTIIEVRLTRRGSVGIVRTLKFRPERRPRSSLGCLRPVTGERMRCPRG